MLEEEDRKEIVKLAEATHTSVIAFVLSLFVPLVGLILGIKAKNEIDESEHTKSGSAFATAAIWIGAIGTLIWAAIIALVIIVSVAGHGGGIHIGSRFDGGYMRHGRMITIAPGNGGSQLAPGQGGFGMMHGFGQMPNNGQLPNQSVPNNSTPTPSN